MDAFQVRRVEHSSDLMQLGDFTFLEKRAPSWTFEQYAVTPETKDAREAIQLADVRSDPVSEKPPQSGIELSPPSVEAAAAPTVKPEVQPVMTEPLMIELVSDPPRRLDRDLPHPERASDFQTHPHISQATNNRDEANLS
jgi:hypothetical protein